MAGYRKLGRTSSQRKALIRGQVTSLLNNGKIVTTEARAKEISKVAEGLIALAVKEKDNFDEVEVTSKVARKDKDGKRVKEVVDGKKVTVYETVEKEIKKDLPSRLHARKQMDKVLYKVTEVPAEAAGRTASICVFFIYSIGKGYAAFYDSLPHSLFRTDSMSAVRSAGSSHGSWHSGCRFPAIPRQHRANACLCHRFQSTNCRCPYRR